MSAFVDRKGSPERVRRDRIARCPPPVRWHFSDGRYRKIARRRADGRECISWLTAGATGTVLYTKAVLW